MQRNGRNRALDIGVLLLFHQLLTSPNSPPITLAAILAQIGIYLGFIPFLDATRLHDLCLMPSKVWYNGDWWRLVFSTFMHANDTHLYYNMISFLWKGRRLERKFGSAYFAYLLIIFSLLVNITLVFLSLLLGDHYAHQCAIGFSGVIFALKTLTNHYYPTEDAWLFGYLPVPSKYACWVELLVIQLLVPNASLLGHLSGIIVGLAFTKGPLKLIMDAIFSALRTSAADTGTPYYSDRRSGFEEYTDGLNEEDQLRRAMDESRLYTSRSRARVIPSAPPMSDEHFN